MMLPCSFVDVCDEILNEWVVNDNFDPLHLSYFDFLGENEQNDSDFHIEAKPVEVKFWKRYESLAKSGPKKVPFSEQPPKL